MIDYESLHERFIALIDYLMLGCSSIVYVAYEAYFLGYIVPTYALSKNNSLDLLDGLVLHLLDLGYRTDVCYPEIVENLVCAVGAEITEEMRDSTEYRTFIHAVLAEFTKS